MKLFELPTAKLFAGDIFPSRDTKSDFVTTKGTNQSANYTNKSC